MTARATVVLLCVAGLLAATGLWAWQTYCEQYGLCYPACRTATNGIEYFKTAGTAHDKSEWIAAGASPGSECLALLSVMKKRYPGQQVAIDYVNLANERKPAPFYQYDCFFEIKSPVFYSARNAACKADSQSH